MKIIILFLVLALSFTTTSITTKVYAFYVGQPGSSIIVPNVQVFVNGITVDKPNKIIVVSSTNKPTFFGYAYSNTLLNFLIKPDSIKQSVTTTSDGYWAFSPEKPLPVGIYQLYSSLTDDRGATTSSKLIATFQIPTGVVSNNGTVIIPSPSLSKLDYLTVSLIVGGFIIILIFIYLVARRHKHVDE